ncbi:MAG: stalk domain-containing protein, partial [Caldisericia bacterium]|nr:stalk domain-containing protein [Caldisericia bacterium]
WKFTQDLKIDWIDNLNWFGIKEVWESNQGLMYALDEAHQAILVFRDNSFIAETPISLVLEPTPEVTYEDHITIKGKIEKDGSIRVGGETVNIDENGFFQKSLLLEIGENVWNVEATHPAKKAVTKEIKIIRKEKIIIQMQVNSKTVMINSQKKIIEAPPFLNAKVNRVFAPIRVVVEAIDGTVEWVATEQKVIIQKEDMELILIIDTPYAFLNGNKIWIDAINENNPVHPVVPTIVGGRVFLPLRFIGENVGFMVEWEPNTQGIVLTYPDPKRPKMLRFMNNTVSESFSEVISFTLRDNGCFISPSPSGESIVMVPSVFNYTGVAKIDGSGKVLDSHAIKTTGNILPLSNGEYLMISLLRGGFKEQDSLAFTWLDQQGKSTKSKRLVLGCEGLRIEEIKNIRETDRLGFEMIMIANTPYEDDVFDGDQKIHLKFNASGDLIETLFEQYPRYSNVNIGKIGSLVLIGYEPIKTFTLFDRNGKSVWSKKIQISKAAGEDPFGGFKTEWLSDDSILLYYFHQKRLCLTRLKSNGEVLWNTTLSMKDNLQIYNLSKPILTSTGGIFLVLQVASSNQKSFSNRIVSLDQSGKVIRCLGLNHARNFYFDSLAGSEEDFWITGSTQHYAFGPSSAILFHYKAGDETSCFILEKDVMNSQALILIESNPEALNIDIQKVKVDASLNDHETTQVSVRFLTKEICH